MHHTRASALATQAGHGQQNSAASILRAAAVEFDQFGFDGASFASIATRAEVSKSLVSYHFPTKALLAAGVVALAYRGGVFMPGAAPPLEGLSSLPAAGVAVAEALLHNPLARAAVRLRQEPDVRALSVPSPYLGWLVRIQEVLLQAQRNSEISRAFDVEKEARLLVSTFVGLTSVAMITGEVFSLVDDVAFFINDRIAALRRRRRSGTTSPVVAFEAARGIGTASL